MIGRVEGEGGSVVWLNRVADEASSCMRKQRDHEKEGKVVSIPKDLKRLLSDLLMCCGIHQEHEKEHEMTSDATRLRIVDNQGSLFANFYGPHIIRLMYDLNSVIPTSALDVDEIDVMSCCMDSSPKSH